MVLIDGAPAYACTREIATLAGRTVTTVEGLANDGTPHPLQKAFLDEQAGQCGYCLSGILVSAAALPVPAAKAAVDTNIATRREGFMRGLSLRSRSRGWRQRCW